MYCYFEILRLLEHPSGFLRRPHTWFSLEVTETMTDGPFLSLQFCRLNSPQERLIGSGESRSALLPGLEAMVPKKTWVSGFLTLSSAHPKVYYDRRFWSIQIGPDHFTLQNPQQQQQRGCWFIGNSFPSNEGRRKPSPIWMEGDSQCSDRCEALHCNPL